MKVTGKSRRGMAVAAASLALGVLFAGRLYGSCGLVYVGNEDCFEFRYEFLTNMYIASALSLGVGVTLWLLAELLWQRRQHRR